MNADTPMDYVASSIIYYGTLSKYLQKTYFPHASNAVALRWGGGYWGIHCPNLVRIGALWLNR